MDKRIGQIKMAMRWTGASERTVMHMAAVSLDACDTLTRAFGTFTEDLHALAEWFRPCGVTSVAMESTEVYWIPVSRSSG